MFPAYASKVLLQVPPQFQIKAICSSFPELPLHTQNRFYLPTTGLSEIFQAHGRRKLMQVSECSAEVFATHPSELQSV